MTELDDIFGGSDYHTAPDTHSTAHQSVPERSDHHPPDNNQGQWSNGGNNQGGGQGNGYTGGGRRNSTFKEIPPEELPLPPAIVISVSLERDTPPEVVQRLQSILSALSSNRYTVRTSYTGNNELDRQIMSSLKDHYEVILPWKGFESEAFRPKHAAVASFHCKRLAAWIHGGWDKLKPAIQAFTTRDVHVLVGSNAQAPVVAYIIYSKDGAEQPTSITDASKYYRMRLKLAASFNIPVFNLANDDAIDRLKRRLEMYPAYQQNDAQFRRD